MTLLILAGTRVSCLSCAHRTVVNNRNFTAIATERVTEDAAGDEVAAGDAILPVKAASNLENGATGKLKNQEQIERAMGLVGMITLNSLRELQ